MVLPCPPVLAAGGGAQVLLVSRPSPGASPCPTGPRTCWSLATIVSPPLGPGWHGLGLGLGLGHPGTRRQGCQEPSSIGGGPAASPGGRGKCYFCLLLSSGTGCPGRGGQRRPLRLGPAHREFLKDAHGCRQDGRRGRGGWAGPPNPPRGRGWGLARGGREEEAEASGHSAACRGGRREPGQARPGPAPALPMARARSPGAMLGWPARPSLAALGVQVARLLGDRGHIVPTLGPAEEHAGRQQECSLAMLPSPTPTAVGRPGEPILTDAQCPQEAVPWPPRARSHMSESSLLFNRPPNPG